MNSKITELVSSIRFWMLVAATCSVLAAHYMPSLEFLFNTIAAFLAAVTGIGTADKFGKSIGGPVQE